MTALAEMAALEAAVDQAQALVRQREAEVRDRTRHLTQLREKRLDYERDVGGGADPDPAFEQDCDQQLGASGIEEVRQDPGGTVVVDRRAEARLAGARAAAEQADRALGQFCADRLDDLEAELTEGVDAERAAVAEAVGALRRAIRPLRNRERRVGEVRLRAGWRTLPDFIEGAEALDDLDRHAARMERAR